MGKNRNRLRKYFVSGLVVFLPLTLTIYVFIFMVNLSDSLIGQYIQPYFDENFGFYISGISVLFLLYIIVLIGFLVTNYIGNQVYQFVERWMIKLPFFKQVYPALKEMAVFLFAEDRKGNFKQVVLVEYPRKGLFSVAFLTNQRSPYFSQKTGKTLVHVFVPSSPSPLTGFTILVPEEDIILCQIGVEEALKFVISGGVVNPGEILTDQNTESNETQT